MRSHISHSFPQCHRCAFAARTLVLASAALASSGAMAQTFTSLGVLDTNHQFSQAVAVSSNGQHVAGNSGVDLFNHLIALRNNLRAGDTAAIADTNRAELQNDDAHFLDHIGEFGATQARLESATSSASERSTAITAESSREGDADLAETLVRITETQTAYQATLQSAAKLMNLSLMDYLR